MKILQNLWQVGGGDLTAPEDAAIYLMRLGQQTALIDAGCGDGHERLVENISSVLPESEHYYEKRYKLIGTIDLAGMIIRRVRKNRLQKTTLKKLDFIIFVFHQAINDLRDGLIGPVGR